MKKTLRNPAGLVVMVVLAVLGVGVLALASAAASEPKAAAPHAESLTPNLEVDTPSLRVTFRPSPEKPKATPPRTMRPAPRGAAQ